MNCPQCDELLTPRFNAYPTEHHYVEIFLDCENDHQYFARIEQEDLIEE
uniref:Uncharacterized protein n=1 Tax=viral metagenome TaxID=1070528 RepID=A0A6M3IG11_9ZZZZ